MELTCRQCGSKFRAAVAAPLTTAVRVACPTCGNQMVLKPRSATSPGTPPTPNVPTRPHAVAPPRRRIAAIADEVRPFRAFLGDHLRQLGFEVAYFELGEPTLDFVRRMRADLLIVNVYLRGKLGVEVSEDIKADPALAHTRVILIGALFRANRFRANPTNLYGADEYIEELIPEREFRRIIHKFFPDVGDMVAMPIETREVDDARRLARLILSDIIIYHAPKVDEGIRDNNFFELLHAEIEEGRHYYESRVSFRVRRDTEIYTETLQQFLQMKREELERLKTGTQ